MHRWWKSLDRPTRILIPILGLIALFVVAVQIVDVRDGERASGGTAQEKPAEAAGEPRLTAMMEPPTTDAGWIVPETSRNAVAEQPTRGHDDDEAWVDKMREWERRTGAVPAAPRGIRLTLHGGDNPVTIHKVEIDRIKCRPAVKGIHIVWLTPHRTDKAFVVDLDKSDPVATFEDVEVNADLPVKIAPADLWKIEISAVSAHNDCDWIAKVTWAYDGRTRVSTIDDQGKPFRTTGLSGRTSTLPILFTGNYAPQAIPDSVEAPPSGTYASAISSGWLTRKTCDAVTTPARGFGWITGDVCQHGDGTARWEGTVRGDVDGACAKIYVVWQDIDGRVVGSNASGPQCVSRNGQSAPATFTAPPGTQRVLTYLVRTD